MRSLRASTAIAAVIVLGVTALAGCTANTGNREESGGSGNEIRIAEDVPFTGFNAHTAATTSYINSKINSTMNMQFNYLDTELKYQKNSEFGEYEVLSEDPLTVKWTINEGVKWSDGEPVDADDLVFAWAVQSAYYNDATLGEDGSVASGNTYFEYDYDTSGFNMTEHPVVGDDNRSITVTWDTPFADWESFQMQTPAHVAAKKAGVTQEELTALLLETPKGDPAKPAAPNEVLAKVAEFWNSGYNTTSLPEDKDLYLSNGPFIVSEIVPERSLTLVRNPDFEWGPEPEVESIVVRFIPDSSAQISALKNGDVDIIAPEATTDNLTKLEELGESVVVEQGPRLYYEHFDLNFTGPFAEADVREAFMKTIPRQQILETVLGDRAEGVEPLNSQVILPTAPGYEEAVAINGSSEFAEVDIEGAKELLNGATPSVRIMYNNESTDRKDAFALIAESASKAGFKIVDAGLPAAKWGAELGTGSYDAALFGWGRSAIGTTDTPGFFRTGAYGNMNGFSDPEADALMEQLITTIDPAEQDALRAQIDKRLWDARYGLPLYQSTGILAISPSVEGLEFTANPYGAWTNFWEWSVAE